MGADTCYAWWIGASLKVLGAYPLLDHTVLRQFIVQIQSRQTGGIRATPDTGPDIVHVHYGLLGLSLMGEPGLTPIYPPLAIPARCWEAHKASLPRLFAPATPAKPTLS